MCINFTFHNVSINTGNAANESTTFVIFTFHNVSINTEIRLVQNIGS